MAARIYRTCLLRMFDLRMFMRDPAWSFVVGNTAEGLHRAILRRLLEIGTPPTATWITDAAAALDLARH